MGGMHDFKPFLGVKFMHTTEEIAKNHAYHRKRYRGLMKIMHSTAFDAAAHSFLPVPALLQADSLLPVYHMIQPSKWFVERL